MTSRSEAYYAPNLLGLLAIWISLVFIPLIYSFGELILHFFFSQDLSNYILPIANFVGISAIGGMFFVVFWSIITARKVIAQISEEGILLNFPKKSITFRWQEIEKCSCYDEAIILKPHKSNMFFLRLGKNKADFTTFSQSVKENLVQYNDATPTNAIPPYNFFQNSSIKFVQILLVILLCLLFIVMLIPFSMLLENNDLWDLGVFLDVILLVLCLLTIARILWGTWANSSKK